MCSREGEKAEAEGWGRAVLVRSGGGLGSVLGGGGENGESDESGGSGRSGGSGEGGHALEPLKHIVSQWTSGGYGSGDSGDGGHAQAQVCTVQQGRGKG